jgi:hypothetical protein
MLLEPPELDRLDPRVIMMERRRDGLLKRYESGSKMTAAELDELRSLLGHELPGDERLKLDAIEPKKTNAKEKSTPVVVEAETEYLPPPPPPLTDEEKARQALAIERFQRVRSPHLSRVVECFKRTVFPPVVEWLTQNITLPREMSPVNPGRFSTTGRRYQNEILECWHPESGINILDMVAGTQIMKTFGGVMGVVYRMKHKPWPALIMGPNRDWTKAEWAKSRLIPLINSNPLLAAEKTGNPDDFTATLMQLRRQTLKLIGSKSPTQIGGMSAGIVCVDEAFKLKKQHSDDAPDAHPLLLAWERSKDFRRVGYFHYMSGSPTSPNHPAWEQCEAGDMRRLHVPCPHCGEWFPFDLPSPDELDEYYNLIGKPTQGDYRSLIWDTSARDITGRWNEDRVAASTRYICPHNGCEIKEQHRIAQLESATSKAHNPYAAANHRSYIIPSFYAPSITFAAMATEFLKASSKPGALENYRNGWLAKTWLQVKASIGEALVLKCKGSHARKTIPSMPSVLVFTADPGGTRKGTNWMVTAIMPNADLVVIDWGVVGSPREFLNAAFLSGLSYPLSGTAQMLRPQHGYIDARYDTELVYAICVASGGFYTPTMGSGAKQGGWWERTEGTTAMKVIGYSDHQAKLALYVESIFNSHRPTVSLFDSPNPRVVLPDDPYTGSSGINTAWMDNPESYAALVAGLSGQKLVEANGEEVFKKVPNDDYGDCLKLAKIVSWIANLLTTSRFTPSDQAPPSGRDYDLHRP